MKNKVIIIISVFILMVTISYLLINQNDAYYKQVELSNNNVILNATNMKFVDTVLSVTLDKMGIIGETVIVKDLSESVKSKFDGHLQASIHYINGVFYLFLNQLDHREAIGVMVHEAIHMLQYKNSDITFNGVSVFWKGTEFSLENTPYDERPWEIEAFKKQGEFETKIYEVLY